MATLAIPRELLSGFAKLEKRIQAKISEIAGSFQRLSADELRLSKGLHLERYQGQQDSRARTIRITDNYRGIVCDLGDNETYVLHTVLPHDQADRWMTNNVFRVNPATGAFEIHDLECRRSRNEPLGANAGAIPTLSLTVGTRILCSWESTTSSFRCSDS